MNEEFPSGDAELEISREALQLLNDELSVVNNGLEEEVRALEALNDDLESLLNSTDIATIFLDRQLNIRRFTPAITRLFHLVAADRGRPLGDISRKYEDPALLADAGRVLQSLRPAEKEVRAGVEEKGWYRRRILPCRTRDERIRGVAITFIDITESKRTLERFRRIVEAAPDAMVVLAKDGAIESVNARTRQLFGYAREELIGKPVEMLVLKRYRDGDPEHGSGFSLHAESRRVADRAEVFGRRKDGSEFPVKIDLSPLEAEGNARVLATIIDITDRGRLAQELRDVREQAERTDQAKSRFLASASHDLRQPLQTLVLLNAVLARKVKDPETLESVKKQGVALSSIEQLLHSFLDLSRLDAGVIKPEVTVFPVAELLGAISTEFAARAEMHGLELRVVPCAAAIRSDAAMLRRIVQNLVDNAISYTQAGRVLLGCRRRGEALRIEVWDTGRGIPAEHLDAIFEEFFQLHGRTREAGMGCGIGLSVARSLAQLLGHRLDVRSAPGKGSMFAVEVPVAQVSAPAPRPGAPGGAQPLRYEGKPGAVVLMVEDDPGVLAAMRGLLESLGLNVLAASSGIEALALLKAGGEQPDLIIADYRLAEGGSGVEMVHRILDALEREIPALLVSGDTLPESVQDMEISGFSVLRKPVAVGQLVAHMNRLLKGRSSSNPLGAGDDA